MKIARKFSLAATAILATVVLLASSYVVGATVTSQGFNAGTGDNDFLAPYAQGHASQATNEIDNADCIECHTSTVPGKALKGKRTAHNVHLKSMWVKFGKMYTTDELGAKINTGCIYCHPDVKESNYSSARGTQIVTAPRGSTPGAANMGLGNVTLSDDTTHKLRRQVSPDFCSRCHSKFNVYGGVHGGTQLPGCTNGLGCHQSWAHEAGNFPSPAAVGDVGNNGTRSTTGFGMIVARNSDTSATTGKKADAYCLRCHGGKAWYQTLDRNYMQTADALTP